ncbi:MAG TPA: hypothetical protein IAC25_05335 [Candidatus Enterenecus stercoripullorum]|nr:hypothetical protein [Candidatus Enterenecus stercoripullorum]
MKDKNKTFLSIRMLRDTHDKLKYVAAYEGRSMSKQILFLVNQCIRNFEREHGPIELPEEPEKPNHA